MHIKEGKKSAAEMRRALLDKANSDANKKYDEILVGIHRGYVEARESGVYYDNQEHAEAAKRKTQEITQETREEIQRINSMNDWEITLLYCERFPE